MADSILTTTEHNLNFECYIWAIRDTQGNVANGVVYDPYDEIQVYGMRDKGDNPLPSYGDELRHLHEYAAEHGLTYTWDKHNFTAKVSL